MPDWRQFRTVARFHRELADLPAVVEFTIDVANSDQILDLLPNVALTGRER
jgi:hypothetical protein